MLLIFMYNKVLGLKHYDIFTYDNHVKKYHSLVVYGITQLLIIIILQNMGST